MDNKNTIESNSKMKMESNKVALALAFLQTKEQLRLITILSTLTTLVEQENWRANYCNNVLTSK